MAERTYADALYRQRAEKEREQLQRRIEAGEARPDPGRITHALNYAMLYGPEVDWALGGEEPMVDEWESGQRVPTYDDMTRLGALTGGFTAEWFYRGPLPEIGPSSLRFCVR